MVPPVIDTEARMSIRYTDIKQAHACLGISYQILNN